MDLFSGTDGNLLPFDGEVVYKGRILSVDRIERYFRRLQTEIPWQQDQVTMFGKTHVTKRKMAWYGDSAFRYTYSQHTKEALLWTPLLLEIKSIVETLSQDSYNSCLLNYYHGGDEGMGWHSDDEKELKPAGTIASLSLGATRKFAFKHKKTKEKIDMILENGSLLLMKGQTQTNWLHALPKTRTVHRARINLTFRTFIAKETDR
ncbi:MAG: alpha-ketoglutarate-dependent dioxygenase AlkB [Bacteroidota bacterium]